jgi:hypothetical protein
MKSLLTWLETLILMMTGLIPAPAVVSNRPVFADTMMKPTRGGTVFCLLRADALTPEQWNDSEADTLVHRTLHAVRSLREIVLL